VWVTAARDGTRLSGAEVREALDEFLASSGTSGSGGSASGSGGGSRVSGGGGPWAYVDQSPGNFLRFVLDGARRRGHDALS